VTPVELLGHVLAAERRSDSSSFDDAWQSAVARARRRRRRRFRAWQDALASTRPAWEAAWERRPATRAERALHAVATDGEREALPSGYVGDCEVCAGPLIHAQRGPDPTYCSRACRNAAHVARRAAA